MAMRFTVVLEEERFEVEVSGALQVRVDGRTYRAKVKLDGEGYRVSVGRQTFDFRVRGRSLLLGERPLDVRFERYNHSLRALGAGRGVAVQEVKAPMPGRVVAVIAREGQKVSLGSPLLILEAMKMQNEVPSPAEGMVKEVKVSPGDVVTSDDVLMVIQ